MKKIPLIGLLLLVAFSFSFSLNNDFVGDDEVKLLHNQFYKSGENFKLLFKKEYLSESRQYYTGKKEYFDSGEVSFRPVTSSLFFLDYYLWKDKPFGYHLTSLLIHLMNVLLVYFLVGKILNSSKVSFLAAALFGLHPLKVEAVCAISYRHDLIACMFALIAFLTYLKIREAKGGVRTVFNLVSLFSFTLGVFAKESVVILPLLFIAYDLYFKNYIQIKGAFKKYIPNSKGWSNDNLSS